MPRTTTVLGKAMRTLSISTAVPVLSLTAAVIRCTMLLWIAGTWMSTASRMSSSANPARIISTIFTAFFRYFPLLLPIQNRDLLKFTKNNSALYLYKASEHINITIER